MKLLDLGKNVVKAIDFEIRLYKLDKAKKVVEAAGLKVVKKEKKEK